MRRQVDSIRFGETTISYEIRRTSTRRTIGITVHSDGYVTVSAPRRLRRTRIAEAVEKKAEWILRKREAGRYFLESHPRQLFSGETIRYLGKSYSLKVSGTGSYDGNVRIRGGRIEISQQNGGCPSDHLKNWYRGRLAMVVRPLVQCRAAQIGKPVPLIQVRSLGERWGSCGKNGRLYFHWKLATLSKSIVDFVVAHEVCHLVHQNHSKEFFRLLSRIKPDWRECQRDLDVW